MPPNPNDPQITKQQQVMSTYTKTALPIVFLCYAVYSLLIIGSIIGVFTSVFAAIGFRYYGTPLRQLPLWVKIFAPIWFLLLVAVIFL